MNQVYFYAATRNFKTRSRLCLNPFMNQVYFYNLTINHNTTSPPSVLIPL